LTLLLLGPAAHAEQRELQLGLQPVYGITYIDQRSPSGGGGNLQLSYGITDAVAIQLHGGVTAHPLAEDMDRMLAPGLLLTWQASVGVMYALDIVRVVPYFEASVGILGVTTLTTAKAAAGGGTALNAGAEIGLGADYMLNRRWAVGVALRYHAFLTDLGRIPLYLTVGPRVVLRFGL
jgi:outer membrane protein W